MKSKYTMVTSFFLLLTDILAVPAFFGCFVLDVLVLKYESANVSAQVESHTQIDL